MPVPIPRALTFPALLALAVLGLGGSAAAAPERPGGTCANGRFCLWEDAGYSGDKYVDRDGRIGKYNLGFWNGDNEISSGINNSNRCVTLYMDDNHQGSALTLQPGYRSNNFKLLGHLWNDNAESYEVWATNAEGNCLDR